MDGNVLTQQQPKKKGRDRISLCFIDFNLNKSQQRKGKADQVETDKITRPRVLVSAKMAVAIPKTD